MPVIKRPKPKAIVFDVTGVIAKKAFMSNSEESKNFIRTYIKDYVVECFTTKEFRLSINFLKNPSLLNKGQTAGPTAPIIADNNATPEEQVESVIANVLWRLDREGVTPALAYFHLNMSNWGYTKGILKTPVYDEVPAVLKKWKEVDKIKLYVSLGSATFLRKVFTQTTAGDLIGNIEGHMNLMTAGKSKDFSILAPLLKEQAHNILVITRVPQDARRANVAKIPAVVILRSDYDPKAVEMLKSMDKSKLKTSQPTKTKSAVNAEALDKEAMSNLETISGNDDDVLTGATSKVTEKDLRDFPVIQKLDELVWTT